jgi:hypothetical protein
MPTETLHQLDSKPVKTSVSTPPSKFNLLAYLIPVVVIITAVFMGQFFAKISAKTDTGLPQVSYTQSGSLTDNKFGEKNEKLCPDKVEGKMVKGGIEGEGTHHLERKGGKSQNVYLTSSTIDLSSVVNKNVRVWGKTYAAQTAGWLMDVCYLEVN